MLIDSHCHLDFPVFDARREQVVESARQAGIGAIVVPGVTAEHWQRCLDLSTRGAEGVSLYPALGLHPCFMDQHRPVDIERLASEVESHREALVAIGEIGLDFQIDGFDPEAQTELLVAQLKIAKAANLPVLLHVRKAHDQMLKQLRRFALPRAGIVHAFSGSEQQAQEYLKLGFKLGFGGAISYSRATKLRRLAAELPLTSIVLETDAPDMALSDWRDAPNEPMRVADVAGIIAQLRGISVEEVAETTSRTVLELLELLEPKR
ncbi:TatD family hydrolase [Marinobacterium lutimaris]|uniref:TatD DNase family protein n=1 Tax=Marinobacterium lutimaris TaxID=568106 RepID=A0A1H6BJV6_9GAMM|nr:TatD family hydrolase [Marinobacterium lutimaris]SEG60934.1 TatD DNase family protein [Marinobacterium lutimaris]